MKHNSILRIVLWSIVIAVLLLTLLGGLLFAKMPRIWHDHEWLGDTLEDRLEENLSIEAVPADESELPDVTIIPPTTPLEHDLSVAGDLKLSEHIEKDIVFVASPIIHTNSEKISITNNGDSALNIYLYNNGEAIREFSLDSGATDTFTGLNGKNAYQIGASADDSILIDLTITD